MSEAPFPLVSVIIPFLNNHDEVIAIKNALARQTWPADQTEILFIDNGPGIRYEFPESFFESARVLEEKNYPGSPYSARNRGIEAAKGDVVVFLDANSTVHEDWLEKGMNCLVKSGADLAAGHVDFDYGENINAAKIVDALTGIRMRQAVEERNVAYTANLFVKKEIFERIGLFEEGVRSGGDVRWTLKATQSGYSLVFCEECVVYKKARSYKALYKKKIRTGKGYVYTWLKDPKRRSWAFNFLRSLKPPNPFSIWDLNPERFRPEFAGKRAGVWLHLWLSGIVSQLAFMYEYTRYKR